MGGNATEAFGCHYLSGLIAVAPGQANDVQGVMAASPIGQEELAELLGGDEGDVTEQMLGIVALFSVGDDPLVASVTLRDQGIEASPIHAVGFVHHIFALPGADAVPVAGMLDSRDPGDPARIVAVIDSGIVHPELLPEWMLSSMTFDNPIDIEALDDEVTESHGTFVAGVIRQLAPDHTVSMVRARRVDMHTLVRNPDDGEHAAAPAPTSELHVLEAITRLINRHQGAQVKALNLSLGAYTCDPTGDKLLVAFDLALSAWLSLHPECVIFAAGGNLPGSVPLFPGAYGYTRAVAAGGNGGGQVVWDPTSAYAEQPADPRLWITDVAPGSKVVNLSGTGTDALVAWSGSSFATAVATASYVRGDSSSPAGGLWWWPDKPVDYATTSGLSYEDALGGVVIG